MKNYYEEKKEDYVEEMQMTGEQGKVIVEFPSSDVRLAGEVDRMASKDENPLQENEKVDDHPETSDGNTESTYESTAKELSETENRIANSKEIKEAESLLLVADDLSDDGSVAEKYKSCARTPTSDFDDFGNRGNRRVARLSQSERPSRNTRNSLQQGSGPDSLLGLRDTYGFTGRRRSSDCELDLSASVLGEEKGFFSAFGRSFSRLSDRFSASSRNGDEENERLSSYVTDLEHILRGKEKELQKWKKKSAELEREVLRLRSIVKEQDDEGVENFDEHKKASFFSRYT